MKKRWERYLKNHLRFSETLLSKSKRQILICTVFETIFQFMWQFLELFKKTYEIWDKGNSPSSMLRGRSPLLSSGIKYFVENIRWLHNNLFLANFLPSQRLSILLQWFFFALSFIFMQIRFQHLKSRPSRPLCFMLMSVSLLSIVLQIRWQHKFCD